MQLPKWLEGWEKKMNHFESSLIVDIPDIKVVKATLNNILVFIAIGTLQKHDSVVSEDTTKQQSDLEWKIFYDNATLPNFTSQERINDFMAGAVAASSGNTSVYNANTKYISSGNRPAKGNAPVLLDYSLAKKIENAKKNLI